MSYIPWDKEPDLKELSRVRKLLAKASPDAVARFEALAKRGSAMSMWYLADAYMVGESTILKNICHAQYWYERAEKAGIVQASHALGRIFFEQNEYDKAIVKFSAGALAGYPPSLYRLAEMYRDGQGTKIDIEKCRMLLAEAASKGHIFAKRELGTLYLSGRCGYKSFFKGVFVLLSLVRDIIAIKSMDEEPELDAIICC